MHNVLNVYSKQLSRTGTANKSKAEFKKTLTDQIDLSPEGKRKATIEKVSDEILNKISELGNKVATDPYDNNVSKEPSAPTVEPESSTDNEFVFNVIDEVNRKKTTTYSAKDIDFLMNSIEQLAKEFVEKKGETAG
jgi:ABC-type sulfate transport system substrate-binding protein